jgi:hypothetical protein
MTKFLSAVGAFFASSFISFFIGCPLFAFYVLISSIYIKWHSTSEATQIVLAVGSALEGMLTLFIAGVLFISTLFMPLRMFSDYNHSQLTRMFLPMIAVFYIPVFICTYFLFESFTMVAYLSVPYLISVTLTIHFFFKHMVEEFVHHNYEENTILETETTAESNNETIPN